MSTVDQGLSITLWDCRQGPEGAKAAGIQVQFTMRCPLPYGIVDRAQKGQELQEYEYSSPGVVHCLMGL